MLASRRCYPAATPRLLSISFWLFQSRIIFASLDKPSKTKSLCRPIHSDSDILWELRVNLFRCVVCMCAASGSFCCDQKPVWMMACMCVCLCECVHNIKTKGLYSSTCHPLSKFYFSKWPKKKQKQKKKRSYSLINECTLLVRRYKL